MKRGLFVDLDGVLANFDALYEFRFGEKPNRTIELDWQDARWDEFFLHMEPLADFERLWEGCLMLGRLGHFKMPVILSGAPPERPEAGGHKRQWVDRHLGPAPLITCQSSEKRLHAKPGDVLVDDWTKYRHLWKKMGGIFVLHTSAAVSLRELVDIAVRDRA